MCIQKAFKTEDDLNFFIPPNSTGLQIWRVNHGGNFGKWVGDIFSLGISAAQPMSHIEGCFSVRVPTEGKNYVIPCGFLVGRNRSNKIGIQIRGQDGVLDGMGNVSGHGVDPTGTVRKVVELCKQVFKYEEDILILKLHIYYHIH